MVRLRPPFPEQFVTTLYMSSQESELNVKITTNMVEVHHGKKRTLFGDLFRGVRACESKWVLEPDEENAEK